MKLGKLEDTPKTASDAAVLGGLDFTVSLHPTGYLRNGEWHTHPSRRTVVRDDTGVPFDVVSSGYPPLQFREAFDFMDTVNPTYVAAGVLNGGRQGFMVVRVPEVSKILVDVDPHDIFAVLRTSHDRTRGVEVSVMPLRDRCMNQLTLNSFAQGVPYRWSIAHTSTMHAKLAEARKSLANVGVYVQRFNEIARRLIKMKITSTAGQFMLTEILPDRPRRVETVEQISHLWATSDRVGFTGTGWGLVNALSEYLEWGRPGGSPQSRFIGALQGQTRGHINRLTGHLLSRM